MNMNWLPTYLTCHSQQQNTAMGPQNSSSGCICFLFIYFVCVCVIYWNAFKFCTKLWGLFLWPFRASPVWCTVALIFWRPFFFSVGQLASSTIKTTCLAGKGWNITSGQLHHLAINTIVSRGANDGDHVRMSSQENKKSVHSAFTYSPWSRKDQNHSSWPVKTTLPETLTFRWFRVLCVQVFCGSLLTKDFTACLRRKTQIVRKCVAVERTWGSACTNIWVESRVKNFFETRCTILTSGNPRAQALH